MERAKQAYLALTTSERAEFDQFIAGTKKKADSPKQVTLRRGDGKRARYNGTAATIVAGSQRSGWVDVLTNGEKVSWRSGAWTVCDTMPLPGEYVLPNDILEVIVARLPLPLRLSVLSVSSSWAQLAHNPNVWASLVTPLVALDFTSERLITLLRRAGKALEVLDLGDGAGNHMSQNRRYDLTADDPETVPLGAIMASMTEASGWSRLHTLRIRHEMPWLKKGHFLSIVPNCTALRYLQIAAGLPISVIAKLLVPTLEVLDVSIDDRLYLMSSHDAHDGDLVKLPFDKSPRLRDFRLRNFISGYTHDCTEDGPIFTLLPPSIENLVLSIPNGAMARLAPEWRHLVRLFINGRKSHDMPDVRAMPMLQVLQQTMYSYGNDEERLSEFYEQLAGCTSMRYLRIDFQGAGDVQGTPEAFPSVLHLPDLWFCEVPHPMDHDESGWIAPPQHDNPQHWRNGQHRLIRPGAEFYDDNHMRALADLPHALLTEIDFDSHPELEDDDIDEEEDDEEEDESAED